MVMLHADEFCLLSRAAAEMHGPLMEVDLFNETLGMRVNTGPGKRGMMLVGALPLSGSELEAESLDMGGQVIGFVEAFKH